MSKTGTIQRRESMVINNDPQRRCYNGCHFSTEIVKTDWQNFEYNVPAERAKERLDFWRDLNDYAVSQRGEDARVEYRFI